MEEALRDVPLYCEFVRMDAGITRLPDVFAILRFRHLLEAHQPSLQLLHPAATIKKASCFELQEAFIFFPRVNEDYFGVNVGIGPMMPKMARLSFTLVVWLVSLSP